MALQNRVEFKLWCDPRDRERWHLAAKQREITLSEWIRRIANEEVERQAALILYKVRVERPHEINAIVEELLRQRDEPT